MNYLHFAGSFSCSLGGDEHFIVLLDPRKQTSVNLQILISAKCSARIFFFANLQMEGSKVVSYQNFGLVEKKLVEWLKGKQRGNCAGNTYLSAGKIIYTGTEALISTSYIVLKELFESSEFCHCY